MKSLPEHGSILINLCARTSDASLSQQKGSGVFGHFICGNFAQLSQLIPGPFFCPLSPVGG